MIDFFFPLNMRSYSSCVRSKRKKLHDHPISLFGKTGEVIFVCVNENISQDDIDKDKTNKKGVTVLSFDTFKQKFF